MKGPFFDVPAGARRPPVPVLRILPALLLFLGCAIPPAPMPDPPESAKLEVAMAEYAAGRYAEAADRFADLAAGSPDERVRESARRGLLCARFLRTQAPAERSAAPPPSGKADPRPLDARLLDPILDKLVARTDVPDPPAQAFASAPEPERPPAPTPRPADDLPPEAVPAESPAAIELRERLSLREEENRRLRRQVRRLETALRTLREQMAAIEEIHQEMYEKKKGIELP
jgi:hypothetical protein